MARVDTSAVLRALVIAAIVTAGLYFGQDVLVPVALSVLLAFMLSPLVTRLERWRLGRIGAVLLVGLFSFGVLGGLIYIFTDQMVELAGKLPEYRENFVARVNTVKGSAGKFLRVQATLREIGQEISEDAPATAAPKTTVIALPGGGSPRVIRAAPREPERPPVPVKVVETPNNPLEQIRNALAAIVGPLGNVGIVIIFVAFILLQREDLRDRLIRLAGPAQLNLTTTALNEAGERVSRYLLMQFLINVTYGIPVALGLYFIGVPNAALWGLLATVLRYLPYLGPWIAATVPILLSFAIAPDWGMPLYTIGLFLVLELLSNNVMEPLLYGHSTGISSVAVLGAAVFWTWLWGAVGLLLSTPLTVLVVVLGRYIPQLNFFTILLGDDPVLDAKTRLYQRLLAADSDEAEKVLEELAGQHPPLEIYDAVLLPVLALAESDFLNGHIDAAKRSFVLDTMASLSGELTAEQMPLSPPADGHMAAQRARIRIACVPAQDEADYVAAALLAQVLNSKGMQAEAIQVETLASELVDRIERDGIDLVCVSAVPPTGLRHLRYLCKRLHARYPQLPVIAGLWGSNVQKDTARQRISSAGQDVIVYSFTEAVEAITPRADLLGGKDESEMKARSGKATSQRLPEAPREPAPRITTPAEPQ